MVFTKLQNKTPASLQTARLECYSITCTGQNQQEKQHWLTTNKPHRMQTSYCRLPEMLQSSAKHNPSGLFGERKAKRTPF